MYDYRKESKSQIVMLQQDAGRRQGSCFCLECLQIPVSWSFAWIIITEFEYYNACDFMYKLSWEYSVY